MKYLVTYDLSDDMGVTHARHAETFEQAVATQLTILREWQEVRDPEDPVSPHAIYVRVDASAKDAPAVSFTERDEAFHNNVKALVRAARSSPEGSQGLAEALDKFRYVD